MGRGGGRGSELSLRKDPRIAWVRRQSEATLKVHASRASPRGPTITLLHMQVTSEEWDAFLTESDTHARTLQARVEPCLQCELRRTGASWGMTEQDFLEARTENACIVL